MRRWPVLPSVFLLALAACGAAEVAPVPETQPEAVRSTDFAVLPCADIALKRPCALIMAGGKRVLVGAPAGVTLGLSQADLAGLDAVLLLSLRGEDVEGLDEVRNASWLAGREGPLPVGGPSGTKQFIGALNAAFEVSDAMIFVEDRPAGGFDAALLALLPGEQDKQVIVFDTGDLQIAKIESADSRTGYAVDYARYRVLLQPCGSDDAGVWADTADLFLGCESGWQLDETVFVYRGDGNLQNSTEILPEE